MGSLSHAPYPADRVVLPGGPCLVSPPLLSVDLDPLRTGGFTIQHPDGDHSSMDRGGDSRFFDLFGGGDPRQNGPAF